MWRGKYGIYVWPDEDHSPAALGMQQFGTGMQQPPIVLEAP